MRSRYSFVISSWQFKPPVGEKLNKPAVVTLLHVTSKKSSAEEFEGKLKAANAKDGAEFIRFVKRTASSRELHSMLGNTPLWVRSYNASSGNWVFRVPHFTEYGLVDEDEDEHDFTITAPGYDWSRSIGISRVALTRHGLCVVHRAPDVSRSANFQGLVSSDEEGSEGQAPEVRRPRSL
jgi:hypothetical protein